MGKFDHTITSDGKVILTRKAGVLPAGRGGNVRGHTVEEVREQQREVAEAQADEVQAGTQQTARGSKAAPKTP